MVQDLGRLSQLIADSVDTVGTVGLSVGRYKPGRKIPPTLLGLAHELYGECPSGCSQDAFGSANGVEGLNRCLFSSGHLTALWLFRTRLSQDGGKTPGVILTLAHVFTTTRPMTRALSDIVNEKPHQFSVQTNTT